MNNMMLIVGLGNPGKKFEKTRHNVGFRAVDEIAANFQFPIFNFQSISEFPLVETKEKKRTKSSSPFNAQISKGEISGQKVILAKPQTFMNNSGKSVKLLTKARALNPRNLIVVHDDIDLPLGKIRISIGRSSAGHKGVESIIRELRTKNFVRFRIGIKPEKTENRTQKTEKFVLEKFGKNEEKNLGGVIKEAVEAIKMTIKEGAERAMNEYNK